MSTATETSQAANMQEQSIAATQKIRSILDIEELTAADLKRLSAALSIAAAEEMAQNRAFASRIKGLFTELMPQKKTPPRAPRKKLTMVEDDGLVPIATGINHNFNPFAPPDPYFLLKLYGASQLHKALNRYSALDLKDVVANLTSTKAAPKLRTKANKEEIITYIITQVTR